MSLANDMLDPACRGPHSGWVVAALGFALLATPAWPARASAEADRADAAAAERETELRATGMTFVGSRSDHSELIVHAEVATFFPDRDMADLEVVRAIVTDDDDGDSFRMTCERAELNVETNDFRAEGSVKGTTADGQRYSAPWVEYEHAAGLLHTNAPVRMVDDTGTFRGDGFRYHVNERKFQMLGNVSVEQGG